MPSLPPATTPAIMNCIVSSWKSKLKANLIYEVPFSEYFITAVRNKIRRSFGAICSFRNLEGGILDVIFYDYGKIPLYTNQSISLTGY